MRLSIRADGPRASAGRQTSRRLRPRSAPTIHRAPGFANQPSGAVAVALASRTRASAKRPWRWPVDRRQNGEPWRASLRSCHSRASAVAHQRHARPARAIGDDAAYGRNSPRSRMAQQKPFDEFLRRGVADGFLAARSLAGLALRGARSRPLPLQDPERAEQFPRPWPARRRTASTCAAPPRHAVFLSAALRAGCVPLACCGFSAISCQMIFWQLIFWQLGLVVGAPRRRSNIRRARPR